MAGRKRGAPTKYGEEMHKCICDELVLGASRTTAAEMCGIDRATLRDWCEKNLAFSRDVTRSIAQVKRTASVTVRKAIQAGDVAAAFRYLAYQEKDEWADSKDINVHVNVSVEAVAARIAKEEGLDPAEVMAEAERILAGVG